MDALDRAMKDIVDEYCATDKNHLSLSPDVQGQARLFIRSFLEAKKYDLVSAVVCHGSDTGDESTL